MHDLQLVGFTTDRRGLIFRTRAGARPEASFVVPVTDELVELVTQLADGPTPLADGPDDPGRPAEVGARPAEEHVPRPRSQMSVRDIQARLRAGEPTSRIAAEAGVDEDWIERFAPPVRAEQQRIVERALDCRLQRPRSAPSAVPLRRAVGMALADKGIAYTVADYEAAWSARLLGHDRWAVTFTYHHRGRQREATWSYDAADDVLSTADRAAAQLGYVAPGRAGEDEGDVIDGIVGDPGATTTRTTAAKKTPAKKTAARKTRIKKTAAKRAKAKKAAGKKAAAKKTPTQKTAAKRAKAKKAATKKAPATKATTKTRVPGKKAAKETVVRKAAAKPKVAVRTAAAKDAGPEDAAPAEGASPPVDGSVDVPVDRRLPDEPPRPADIPIAPPPVADRTAAPVANGRPRVDAPAPAGHPGSEPEADDVDPTSARRARAAERNASTVHFRSGSAAPVRVARDPHPPRASGDRPAPDERPRPDQGETNGAARPATRRRRQLRAR